MAAAYRNGHRRKGIANASAVLRTYSQLAKVRLTLLVVATTAVGFMMAGGPQGDPTTLAWTLLGTGLAAAGSMALDQVLEADRDARMERTRNRPLPSGAVSGAGRRYLRGGHSRRRARVLAFARPCGPLCSASRWC